MYKRAWGLEDDPLSAASAGLLALGVPRKRRTATLDLLGAMIDLATSEGHVEVDRPLYEVEQLVGLDAALESYGWLEQLGVIARTGSGWRIEQFAAHHGPAGATGASLDVLHRHLASIGAEDDNVVPLPVRVAAADPAPEPAMTVVPMKKWRRAVPMAAAGIAASVAVVAGVSQFVPQAAVTSRNAAVHAAAPTSVLKHGGAAARQARTATTVAQALTAPPSTVASASTPTSALTPATAGLVGTVACVAPRVVTAITSVNVVPLPLSGDHGQTIWVAVVKGTATLTDSADAIVLPGLSVVGHVVGGDTEGVLATLSAPLLLPNTATPFSAVVTLGDAKPASAVTASATATGLKSC